MIFPYTFDQAARGNHFAYAENSLKIFSINIHRIFEFVLNSTFGPILLLVSVIIIIYAVYKIFAKKIRN